jgi:hypothetical protein
VHGFTWWYDGAVRPGLLLLLLLSTSCKFDGSTPGLGVGGGGGGRPDAGFFDDGGAFPDAALQGDAALQDDAALPTPDAAVAPNSVDSFSDGFSDSTIGSEWSVSQSPSGCTVGETGSRIQFSMDGSSASLCVLTTTSFYDLRDSAAMIDIPPITNFKPEMSTFMAVSTAEGDFVEFGFNDGVFYASIVEASLEIFGGTSPYLPNPSFWRIRESAGQLYLESSLNQSSWEIEFQQPVTFPVSSVRVAFGVRTSGPMSGSIGIGVPGYNQ